MTRSTNPLIIIIIIIILSQPLIRFIPGQENAGTWNASVFKNLTAAAAAAYHYAIDHFMLQSLLLSGMEC